MPILLGNQEGAPEGSVHEIMKQEKHRTRGTKRVAPRTAEQYFARSERFQETWNRAVGVVSKMRTDNVSLRQASRDFGIDPRTVARLAGSALRKQSNGRYEAKRSDRLLRVLVVPTSEGTREIGIRDSRQGSHLGKYWTAVQHYLATGERSALSQFRNKTIRDASGAQVPLLTNPRELDRLGSAGVLSFESLYARSA